MPDLKHTNARVYSPTQVLLPEISYQTFTYPGDEEALAALKSVPGAGPVLTWLQENFTEQITYLNNNEQHIRATKESYPSLFAMMERCCEILSCPLPELYITTNPVLNAYTAGQRRTCIVLHSGLIESLTPDELCFVIGHEIGHIKCAHGLYRQLGDLLIRYWDVLASVVPIPGIGLLRIPLLIHSGNGTDAPNSPATAPRCSACKTSNLLCAHSPNSPAPSKATKTNSTSNPPCSNILHAAT